MQNDVNVEQSTASSQPMSPGIRFLHEEFSSRSQKNARYSLRAFAKHLGVSHTLLSLVMSGKRPLSSRTIQLLMERLEIPPEKAAALLQGDNKKNKTTTDNYEFMDMATVSMISNWVHFAILSLVQTSKTLFTPKWIAKRLGINETQAKISFQRLIDIGLLAQADGHWKQTGKPIKVENTISTSITKKFQRELIEKSLESLENDPIEVRNFSSMTMAMDPALIPYATERIKEFRRELAAELEARGNPEEVYNLTIQIYPVSKKVT